MIRRGKHTRNAAAAGQHPASVRSITHSCRHTCGIRAAQSKKSANDGHIKKLSNSARKVRVEAGSAQALTS